jgi:hypothetical protein
MKKQLFLLSFAALAMQAAPALAYSSDYWRHHEDGARDRGHGHHNGQRTGRSADTATTTTTTETTTVDEGVDGHAGEED